MSTATTSFGIVKIISEIDGMGQRDEVFLTVDETQSIFDCLVEKFGASKYWTKLLYRENGVHVIGWRAIAQSGAMYPLDEACLDEQFHFNFFAGQLHKDRGGLRRHFFSTFLKL